jgi:hypothetical protein
MTLRLWVLSMMASAVVGGLVAAGVVVLVLPGAVQAAPGEQGRGQFIPYLQVQRVEMVDETGLVRGVLVADTGRATFDLRNQEGEVGVWLQVTSNAASLVMPGSATTVLLNQNQITQRADIAVQDMLGGGVSRAAMTASAEHGPRLEILDAAGRARWSAP